MLINCLVWETGRRLLPSTEIANRGKKNSFVIIKCIKYEMPVGYLNGNVWEATGCQDLKCKKSSKLKLENLELSV